LRRAGRGIPCHVVPFMAWMAVTQVSPAPHFPFPADSGDTVRRREGQDPPSFRQHHVARELPRVNKVVIACGHAPCPRHPRGGLLTGWRALLAPLAAATVATGGLGAAGPAPAAVAETGHRTRPVEI